MSKTLRKNKWLKISTAISTVFSTSQVKAIDLQSKTKTVDKTDFNVISSPFKKPLGQYSIIGEVSDTKQPLILKQANGKNQTLIEGLQAFELSFLYELSDSIQLGILVPGEKPYGLIGPFNEAKSYLGNILIEPKVYISNDIALIPIYYVPTSNQADLQISGVKETLDLGLNNGAYGLKMSMGKKHDNGIVTAYQIGAIIAPEAKFRDIDQSMRLQFGAGVKKEISGGLKLLAEAYGEKYKSNMPLEALAMIEYSNKNFMVRFGGGSGDLQGSGSNTTRLLANFAYYFGTEPKSTSSTDVKVELTNTPVSEDDYQKFKKKVEKTEEEIRQEESPLDMHLDAPTENQKSPDSGSLFNIDEKNNLPLVSVKVKKETPENSLPFEKAKQIFLDTIDRIRDEDDLSFLKDMSDESFKRLFFQNMEGKNFGNTIQRTVASLNSNSEESMFLEKISQATVTQTAIFEIQRKNYHWTESKAKYVMMNLRRANASLKENLDLYRILKDQNKSTEKVLNELNWGIRVFKRNLDSWNLLTSSYMEETGKNVDRLNLNTSVLLSNYFDQAVAALNDNNLKLSIVATTKPELNKSLQTSKELQETQEFVVKVMTRLNVRKTPEILIDNVLGQLKNGDIVRSLSSKVVNNFVEVEVVKSTNLTTDHKPIYVNLKYLYPIAKEAPQTTLSSNTEESSVLEDTLVVNNQAEILNQLGDVKSVLDSFTEVSKINGDKKAQENLEQIKAILSFDPSLNVGDKNVATDSAKKEEAPQVTETEQKMIEIMDKAQSLPVDAPEQSMDVVEVKNEEVTPTPTDAKPEPVVVKKSLVLNKKEVKAPAAKAKKVEVVEQKTDVKSSVEIIYDEPVVAPKVEAKKVVEVKNKKNKSIKKDNANKLPEKTISTVQVENITPAPEKTVVEVKNESKVETKPEVKETPVSNVVTVVNEAPKATEVKPSEPVSVVEVKKDEPVVDPKAEAKKREMDAIDQLIEMKRQSKKAVVVQPEVKPTPTDAKPEPTKTESAPVVVDTKDTKKVEVKPKSESVFEQVLQQKNEEYLKAMEKKNQQPQETPEQEDPLKMKTDGQTTYETGPSFDDQ